MDARTVARAASLTLCYTTLMCTSTYAQVLDLEHYSTRNGLVFNDVHSMYQDPLGRLWLGTSEGLSIYDGSEFKNYGRNDGLPLEFIVCMAASQESPTAAWIGTLGGGVCKLENDRFSYMDLGPDISTKFINALVESKDGALWVGTGAGLFMVEKEQPTPVPLQTGKLGITGLAETKDGKIWVGLTQAVALLERNQSPLYFDLQLDPDDYVSAMHFAADQSLWLGTSRGELVHCNQQGLIERAKISTIRITDITSDREDMLWICSEDGLFSLNRKAFRRSSPLRLGSGNGFSGNFFTSVFNDREENLWIGGLRLGLYKLRDRSLLKFPLSPLVPGHMNIPPAVVDTEGHLWIIDADGLVELWSQPDSNWKVHKHRLQADHPLCLQLGPNKTLWIGFLNRDIHIYDLHRSDPQSSSTLVLRRRLRRGAELPKEEWGFFILDSRRTLWLSVHAIGVVVLQGEDFSKRTLLRPPTEVPHSDVRALVEGPNGDIWIGGLDGGIAVYRQNEGNYLRIKRFTSRNGLDDDGIRAIYIDSLGRCWAGTRWGGITLTDGETWRSLTVSDGLLSNAVVSIVADPHGTIWLGTPLGLQGVDARSFKVTRTIPGLTGESVQHCGIAGDIIWVYTPKFLATYDLSSARANMNPPLISIREFRVNGAARTVIPAMELSYTENNIAIHFAGISLKNERGVRYRFRLLGAEQEWTALTPYRSVTYAALKPGAYTFEVQAMNSDGITSASPASVSFAILPPLWQRWWFVLSVVVVISGILWAMHRARLAKLLELERTRVRIAQDLHDEIGSTLSSISYFAQAIRAGDTSNKDRLLSLIAESSSKAKGAISDIIWSIDPSNDNWEELLARMRRHASDVLESKNIRYTIDLPDQVSMVPPTMQERRHLWLLFKEIVANSTQHSHCARMEITMKSGNGAIELIMRDDGTGFDPEGVIKGTGLKSIQDRASALGASIELKTRPGEGTSWNLRWRRLA